MLDHKEASGKILRINLTDNRTWIDTVPSHFLENYMGGAIGAYYLLALSSAGVDPLSPENVLTFTPGYLADLAVGAFNRIAITAKSPLTGAIIDSQAGGFWGPECKKAGFDAVVIQGRARNPVYIMIKDGGASIKNAEAMWGLETGPAEDMLKSLEGATKLRSCIIGPAGENMVRYANIANELRHFAGRGGLGAVMGSKNLKAVAVQSAPSTAPPLHDRERVLELLKEINRSYAEDDFFNVVLTPHGTPWGLWHNQDQGRLPTHNFQEGVFAGADRIDHFALADHPMSQPSKNCFACRVRCKRSIEYKEAGISIERRYGGAEYESLGNFGPLLGIDDPVALEKANELCSRYSIDTISCGATIAWAVDSYQRGLITTKDTGGLALDWGEPAALLELIELIAHRKGFGDLLAEGSMRAAETFGPATAELAVHNKGMEWPAVEPRVDLSQALAYAVSPIGADHMTTAGPDCGPEFEHMSTPPREEGLGEKLAQAYFTQRTGGSFIDGFGLCRFLVGATGLDRTLKLLKAARGWETDIDHLLAAGDRRMCLFRAYNAREGFTMHDDIMPPIAYKPLRSGPEEGTQLDPQAHSRAIASYYEISGWDPKSGWPTADKLKQLSLEWMVDDQVPKPIEVKNA